jgi:glutamate dehydrogenase/leucine dehydrogenase
MLEKLKKFENKKPEIIFSWKDPETEAEGWTVINSLTMEIKFAVSGPDIGGAKSGINFDPNDPRKSEVLKRWFQAVSPLLKNYYGTGGDLNIDEIKEVIPITSKLKISHPQQGIVIGHLKAYKNDKERAIEQLQKGVSKIIKNKELSPDVSQNYKVADMITGYGVAMSVLHFYKIWGGEIKNKKVIIQGFGNVGAPTAFYLSQAGMKISGITDREGGLISDNGFNFEEIKDLISKRKDNLIVSKDKLSMSEINEKLWISKSDVLIPAAGSRLINENIVKSLIDNGLELISSGANVPFQDEEIFFGKTSLYADSNISVIPDFIANCGMARVFAYLMKTHEDINEENIFKDVSKTIENILKKVHQENANKTHISQKSMEIVLDKIG